MIKAIETYYNGYRFRSRLEARWAVFFDELEIEYQYEPEGFELSNGKRYLPDFYLPRHKIYVEVKSADKCFIKITDPDISSYKFIGNENNKYHLFATDCVDNGMGVWFVFGDPMCAMHSDIIGENGNNVLLCKLVCTLKKLHTNKKDVCVCDGKSKKISECHIESFAGVCVDAICKDYIITCNHPNGTCPDPISALPLNLIEEGLKNSNDEEFKNDTERILSESFTACEKARQARFEYGENR